MMLTYLAISDCNFIGIEPCADPLPQMAKRTRMEMFEPCPGGPLQIGAAVCPSSLNTAGSGNGWRVRFAYPE